MALVTCHQNPLEGTWTLPVDTTLQSFYSAPSWVLSCLYSTKLELKNTISNIGEPSLQGTLERGKNFILKPFLLWDLPTLSYRVSYVADGKVKEAFFSQCHTYFFLDNNMNIVLTSVHFYSLSSKTTQHLHLQLKYLCLCMFVCLSS